MKKFLLPLLLVFAGLGGGIGAGLLLKPAGDAPDDDVAAAECPPPETAIAATAAARPAPPGETQFVKFHNQFMIPILDQDVVESMMVLSISVEVDLGGAEAIYAREPKLRDAFLRVLFDHANAGGFSGNFLSSVGLDTLRSALREAAIGIAGPGIYDVLIVDLVRQDV